MQPRQFISSLSSLNVGGYTVIPVSKGHCLDLPFHIKRLRDSYVQLCSDNSISYDMLCCLFLNEIRVLKLESSTDGFLTIALVKCKTNNSNASFPSNFEIKYLYSENTKSLFRDSSSQLFPLTSDIPIETYPFKRSLPSFKDIQWPIQRSPIEAQRSMSGSVEIILKDDDVYLEGLTSNFFALNSKSKVIYTSVCNVLNGSMSRLVHSFCHNSATFKKYDIRIDSTVPLTNDIISTCDALFLTSATKPIFPVSTLYDYDYFTSTLGSSDDRHNSKFDKILNRKFEYSHSELLQDLRFLFIQGLKDILHESEQGNNDNSILPYPLWWRIPTSHCTNDSPSLTTVHDNSIAQSDSDQDVYNSSNDELVSIYNTLVKQMKKIYLTH